MVHGESAFTLIELLVVMTIIGILTAIAVPEYQSYRARSFDLRALSDLRNVAIAEEAYFLDSEQYLSCEGLSCSNLPGIVALSQGVSLQITATDTNFTGRASHRQGSGREYLWDSLQGGLLH